MNKISKISAEFIEKAMAAYTSYKSDKSELNERICQNEKWYRKWHEVNKNGEYDGSSLTAATAFVFSAIENKYADAMDNYPHPKILEREPGDRKTAQLLSKIIPVQLGFEQIQKMLQKELAKKIEIRHGGLRSVLQSGKRGYRNSIAEHFGSLLRYECSGCAGIAVFVHHKRIGQRNAQTTLSRFYISF